uniref:Uncharacterized protein n=1 Tax=Prasinoderma singulare TaxID=676789 RepID=A0A7S3BC33_9VIRI
MPRPRKSDSTKFYKLLGVEQSASAAEIKKAYRKSAMKNHPDKGGDSEVFKEITAAYEVLSNPEKKQIYDEYGEDALKEGMGGGPGGGNPFDIFEAMFGGGMGGMGGSSRGRRQRRGEDVVHQLKMSLEDLYNGVTKKLSLSKNLLCPKCDGTGSKSGRSTTCQACGGQGFRMQVRQIGPGMIQQVQVPCSACRGTGECISAGDRCDHCKGNKVVQQRKILEVFVEKGMRHGQKIVFQGEADEAPDTLPGDIVFVVQQKEHKTFTRKGSDLVVEKEVSLVEALTGYTGTLTHLDKRVLAIKTQPGEVIRPNEVKKINDEGMPTHGRPFDKGALYVKFKVVFPEDGAISEKEAKALQAVLGGPGKSPMDLDDAEECHLRSVDFEAEMRQSAARSRQYGGDDSDDEDPRRGGGGAGGPGVQCAQQ